MPFSANGLNRRNCVAGHITIAAIVSRVTGLAINRVYADSVIIILETQAGGRRSKRRRRKSCLAILLPTSR
jgi:hypothetical protein